MPLAVELAEIRDFLAGHPPFNTLPSAVLESIPHRLSIAYHRRGSVVMASGLVPDELLVVRSGAVELHTTDGELVERGGTGTCVGGEAMAAGQPQPLRTTALEDTLVLVLPGALFEELRVGHVWFAAFFSPRSGGRLQYAVGGDSDQQLTTSDRAVLQSRVGDLVQRAPVVVAASDTIRSAARVMAEERISSVLVTDRDRLVGIMTDRDLRNRVVAVGHDLDRPVATVMTADPVTVDPDDLAVEALLELGRRNIHHLPLLEEGRPVGMVTATDLMRLQQASPVHLVGQVAKAADVATVADLAARLGRVVVSLVRQGTSAYDAGRVVTMVGDAIEQRVLSLAEEDLGPPPVPFAWLTLGSRARFEQALGPDQDHALVVHDDYRAADHAAYFGDLAERVTHDLEAVGLPRCRGDKMASNPRWRLPLAEWRQLVADWVARPTPESVLEASVFFDLRHLYGEATLTESLLASQRVAARNAPLFLAHLAAHAANQPPPLGFFRGLMVERSGENRDKLDLKRRGLNLIVEIARVHGLASGVHASATQERLEAAAAAGLVSPVLAADLRDAWEFLAQVRLRHQAEQVRAGGRPDNHVDPSVLSSFEQRHLKSAFGVIRLAQSALAQRYPVHTLS